MQFRIADTFTDSLAKLTGEEQKAVKTTAFDLQMDPARPGLRPRIESFCRRAGVGPPVLCTPEELVAVRGGRG